MSRKTFVNLPVKDLAKTIEFFNALGFSFNQQFTSPQTACLIISEDAYAMLHVEPSFKEFTGKDLTDTSKSAEVIVGLSAESREEVDALVNKVVAAGGQALGEAQDQGFMYMRGFRDLDGHQWSFIYMDMSATPGQ
ncbi:VOC family protein [Actinopolymorpha alba]|uniref:VOC family protein n=1 Tax=Actinopolymorpha alba TaxID=533267 RepID=UPI00036C558C|nr:VOC family protein [Actinopolymorpha alba]